MRTYKTLSLSLPPGITEELAARGKSTGRTAARVAAELVLRDVAWSDHPKEETRRKSWCCQSQVIPVQGKFLPERTGSHLKIDIGERFGSNWLPVIALLCKVCGTQMHGRDYEGWLSDA